MDRPRLFRRRYIPDELVELANDEILKIGGGVIVTKWKTLKPRADFCRGYSCYFLNEGCKISRFLDESGKCVYIYCDIVMTEYNEAENAYIFNDLLVDVIVCEGGFVKVVDLDEVGLALEAGYIDIAAARYSLVSVNNLLNKIYGGGLGELTRHISHLE